MIRKLFYRLVCLLGLSNPAKTHTELDNLVATKILRDLWLYADTDPTIAYTIGAGDALRIANKMNENNTLALVQLNAAYQDIVGSLELMIEYGDDKRSQVAIEIVNMIDQRFAHILGNFTILDQTCAVEVTDESTPSTNTQ